ncbi:MAG: FKBP-type peptidyl-prolyl cis-trans isomerase [Parachlamydiaceae bacterium]|nr:FKBP-type peptidyl-prolyl cis-trans isomerase [Parachlamydiaceae bacterium]
MLKNTRLMAITSFGIILSCFQAQADDKMMSSQDKSNSYMQAEKAATSEKNADQPKADQPIDMTKLSEAFGNFIGRNLQSPGLKFDMESLIKGIREGAEGKASPLTEKEYEEMMAAVQERAFKEMSETNLKSANDYMTKNAKVTGVVEVVPGKLQYQIQKEGTGPVVEAHSSPKIHYSGKYQDGTVFGSSEEMGAPITIPLDQTIPGFSKGIVGMKEGEKRRLFVHPDLGYGTTGQLPPNELLIFEIELVKAHSDDEKAGADASSTEDDEDFYADDEDDEDNAATKKTDEAKKTVTPSTSTPSSPKIEQVKPATK